MITRDYRKEVRKVRACNCKMCVVMEGMMHGRWMKNRNVFMKGENDEKLNNYHNGRRTRRAGDGSTNNL